MLPGTLIATGLEFMGIDPASCNCVERAEQMDAWGVDGCREKIETIVGWFVDEGRRNAVVASDTPQFRNLVRAGVRLVLNRSEQLLAMEQFSDAIQVASVASDDGSSWSSPSVSNQHACDGPVVAAEEATDDADYDDLDQVDADEDDE